jgi:hypothetical protein
MQTTYRNKSGFTCTYCRPHYHHLIHSYLSQHLPKHWIRCTVAEDQALSCWPPRLPDCLIKCCVMFSYLDMLWTAACTIGSAWAAKMNHHCHLINQSWNAAAGMSRNWLSAGYLQCHKEWTHRAVMRFEQKTCRISLSIYISYITILSAIQLSQFYELCQGIKTNPVHSLGIVNLCL